MNEQGFNLEDELERKTLDALSRIVTDFEQGAISQPQAAFGLQVLFSATSGLVGNEAFNLVSDASKQINAESKRDRVRRLFVHAGKQELVLLDYRYGEAEVTLKRGKYPLETSDVNRWDRASRATFETEINPFEAARQRFDGYADALRRQGFLEIK